MLGIMIVISVLFILKTSPRLMATYSLLFHKMKPYGLPSRYSTFSIFHFSIDLNRAANALFCFAAIFASLVIFIIASDFFGLTLLSVLISAATYISVLSLFEEEVSEWRADSCSLYTLTRA